MKVSHRAAPDYTVSVDVRRAISAMETEIKEEARKGHKMDVQRLNESMYRKLRAVAQRINPRPNKLQWAMINQELERVRRGVQPSDIRLEQQ